METLDNSQDALCYSGFSEGREQLVASELRVEHLDIIFLVLFGFADWTT